MSEMYSSYKRQRILYYDHMGHKASTICCLLWEKGLKVGRVGIHKFLKKYREIGSIDRKVGSGIPTKLTAAIQKLVRPSCAEWTSHEAEDGPLVSLFLGMGIPGKRLLPTNLAGKQLVVPSVGEGPPQRRFEDVIWMDKCSVQMEIHRRFCCRNRRDQPKAKPKCATMRLLYTLLLIYITDSEVNLVHKCSHCKWLHVG